jgi:hypothetical protein
LPAETTLSKEVGFVASIVGINQSNSEIFRYEKAQLQLASGSAAALP